MRWLQLDGGARSTVDDATRDNAPQDPPKDSGPYSFGTVDGTPESMYHSANVADPERERWRSQIATIGGVSPLLHFVDAPGTRIELSTTHPGGLPQFISGQTTLLSSLIRDDLALRRARTAAGRIADKGAELRSIRGIDAIQLAIGLAFWRHDGEELTAPVLLRPLAIRRHGSDFELKLRGRLKMNPALVRTLEAQFRLSIDGDAVVALALHNGVFKPQPVIDELRRLTAHLPWFHVEPRLVVSSFAEVAPDMLADAARLDHPILDAVAGNENARAAVALRPAPQSPDSSDVRPPSTDRLLLDADPEQEKVIAQIESGASLTVRTLPGTGNTQTVVNAIGALVARNRRVLVVGSRPSSLTSIVARLERVGLPGLTVSATTLRHDLIAAIRRNERTTAPHTAEIDDALVRLRQVILDYRAALAHPHPQLHVSMLDTLTALAALALEPEPPATRIRLDLPALKATTTNRDRLADRLTQAARLGEFRYGPDDSPWYGASFRTTAETEEAHALAVQLHSSDLPRLLDRGRAVIDQTPLRQFESVAELGVFVDLLLAIRRTLERFHASVFDRPLGELIAATAPKRDTPEMSNADRRRLRKHAEVFLRPGQHVTDLHTSLRGIQSQRTLWQRYAEAGAVPQVPVGLDDLKALQATLDADLAVLDVPLGFAGPAQRLAGRPMRELTRLLAGLAQQSEVLTNLQERTAILQELRELGLDPLLTDLARRRVPDHQVTWELELAWWQSVFELLLADPAMLGGKVDVVHRLESDFAMVDQAHAESSAGWLAWHLAEQWRVALVDHPGESERLRARLRASQAVLASLAVEAPNLLRTLAPVWLATPYDVARLPNSVVFDAVILVDAGATTFAESLGAIRRARQVVAFGDPVTQTPRPFTIAVPEGPEPIEDGYGDGLEATADSLHADSALAQLGTLLPSMALTRSYRAGGEDLTALVNQRFFGNQIVTLPWAGSFLGRRSIAVTFVTGSALPNDETDAVESVDAEVTRVVELVRDHVALRQDESLLVVSASARHATRVNQAIIAAMQRDRALADFVLADRDEPFAVLTLDQAVAQSRDRVIFSVGYGLTPHGRLLSDLGVLSAPGGDRLLAVAMTRPRRSIDIVAAFRPEHVDRERQSQGVCALADLLERTEVADPEPGDSASVDPMLGDLATRLRRRGIRVELDYHGEFPLVACHEGRAVVVETDSTFRDMTVRESLRLRPRLLRRLGWHYIRVHAFEVFSEPEAVARRIALVLGIGGTGPIPSADDIE